MHNYIKIALASFLMLFSLGLCAQDVGNDIVYLHNGSIIRGTVIEYIVDDHVKIITVDEKVFEYSDDQVREVALNQTATKSGKKNALNTQSKGYYNATNLGLLFGQGPRQTRASLSIQMINGHQFNKHWSFGFGLGIESFDLFHVPTFADVRYHIGKSSTSPYITFQGGYTWPIFSDNDQFQSYSGGPMAGIEFGIRNYISDHSAIVMSIGYRYQRLRSQQNNQWWGADFTTTRIDDLNRIAIRFGFIFN